MNVACYYLIFFNIQLMLWHIANILYSAYKEQAIVENRSNCA